VILPIKVTPVADAHIQKAASWWLANREKTPQAFKEELQRAFALISLQPEAGATATNVSLRDVRRIHLSRVDISCITALRTVASRFSLGGIQAG
jgi:hypothetical protein